MEGGHLQINKKDIKQKNFCTNIESDLIAPSSQKMQIWYWRSKNGTESLIRRSWRTFSPFGCLLMCLNPMNESGVMIVETCRWLLEILLLAKWSNRWWDSGQIETRSRETQTITFIGKSIGFLKRVENHNFDIGWTNHEAVKLVGFSRYDFEL
jgi:hypothetical protein